MKNFVILQNDYPIEIFLGSEEEVIKRTKELQEIFELENPELIRYFHYKEVNLTIGNPQPIKLNFDNLSDSSKNILRQRHLDLEENDDSCDDDLKKLNCEQVAGILCGWELGSDEWIEYFIGWISEATSRYSDDIKKLLFNEINQEIIDNLDNC